MAMSKAVMADEDYMSRPEPPRETSIRAHLVTSISVTMSTAEMGILIQVLERITNHEALATLESQVVAEFTAEVKRLA